MIELNISSAVTLDLIFRSEVTISSINRKWMFL
jgi:hypothetical protein